MQTLERRVQEVQRHVVRLAERAWSVVCCTLAEKVGRTRVGRVGRTPGGRVDRATVVEMLIAGMFAAAVAVVVAVVFGPLHGKTGA